MTKQNIYVNKLFLIFIGIHFIILPIYKICEVYYSFPHINFGLIRGFLFIILISSILYILIYIRERKREILDVPFLLFYFITLFIILINYDLRSINETYNEAYLNRVDSVIIMFPLMYLSGFFYNKSWDKYINIYFIVFSIFLLFNSDILIQSFIDFSISDPINYIKISDSYMFIALLNFKNIKKNFLLYFVSILCLFLVPSRANLFLYLLFTIFYMRLYKSLNFTFVLIILISILFYFFSYEFFFELIQFSRFNFLDSNDDSSLIYRIESIRNGFNEGLYFFTGDFMNDITKFSMSGYEAHSHISILNQFGLIPFILFVYMLITTFKNIKGKPSQIKIIILVFNLSIIFFKSFLYPFFWFNYSLSKYKLK
tara:strand:- start:39 stop:1151 length:1113 start_codon:yes stop_codon:yes gene_type:complete